MKLKSFLVIEKGPNDEDESELAGTGSSYFAVCNRDQQGHCLPSGKQDPEPEPRTRKPEDEPGSRDGKQGLDTAVQNFDIFKKKYAMIKDTLKREVRKAGEFAKKTTKELALQMKEKTDQEKTVNALKIAFRYKWGTKNPTKDVPIYKPDSVWMMIPGLAIAESLLQGSEDLEQITPDLKSAQKKADKLDMKAIVKAGVFLAVELEKRYLEYLKGRLEKIQKLLEENKPEDKLSSEETPPKELESKL